MSIYVRICFKTRHSTRCDYFRSTYDFQQRSNPPHSVRNVIDNVHLAIRIFTRICFPRYPFTHQVLYRKQCYVCIITVRLEIKLMLVVLGFYLRQHSNIVKTQYRCGIFFWNHINLGFLAEQTKCVKYALLLCERQSF